MNHHDDSTVSLRPNGKHNWDRIIKIVLTVLLFGIAAFLTVTQDWIGTTKQAVVSSTRVEEIQKQLAELKAETARKDVMEPRLKSLEKGQDRLEERLASIDKKLDILLLKQK